MNEEVTVSQAAELTGLTPGQVSRQIFLGLVVPEVHAPNGIGDASVLSPKNIRELRLIARLKHAGIKQETIVSIVNLLAESKMEWWKGGDVYVVALNDRWFVTDNPFDWSNRKTFDEEGFIILAKV